MEFLVDYWQWILIGFVVLEKIVKISPVVWDDILVDGLKSLANALHTQATKR